MSKDDSKTMGVRDHGSERDKSQLRADGYTVAVRFVTEVWVAGWMNKGGYAYDWRCPLNWAVLGRTRERADRYKQGRGATVPTGVCLPSAVERTSINLHAFISLGRPCLQGSLASASLQGLHSRARVSTRSLRASTYLARVYRQGRLSNREEKGQDPS